MFKTFGTASLILLGATIASSAFAWEEGQLTVWVDANKGAAGLQEVGNLFKSKTGISVTVESPQYLMSNFQRQVANGEGPDIVIGPHYELGTLAKTGLIATVAPSKQVKQSLYGEFWAAVTHNDQLFGYPMAVEGPTQICNRALVQAPFASLDDLMDAASELALHGKKPLMWDYANAYFSYGFISSEGGFAFPRRKGIYDSTNTGVANVGAIKGVEAISTLVNTGMVPLNTDYELTENAFLSGDVACIINGPWAWSGYEKAGIDFVVGAYPQVEQGEPKVLISVLTAAINASSPNQEAAVRFLETYLMTEDGLSEVNDDKPLGAVTHEALMKSISEDQPHLSDAMDVWKKGEPIPSIPEMKLFWLNVGDAITAATRDRQPAKTALEKAAALIVQP